MSRPNRPKGSLIVKVFTLIHTKTPKNRGFQKRYQKWILQKTEVLHNALDQCERERTEVFENAPSQQNGFQINEARETKQCEHTKTDIVRCVLAGRPMWTDKGPVHTAPFSYENGVKLLRFALRSHCSAVKTELFENANENAYIWKRCILKTIRFQCERQTRRRSKTLHIPLLIECIH